MMRRQLAFLGGMLLLIFLMSGCFEPPTYRELVGKLKGIHDFSYTIVQTTDGTVQGKLNLYASKDKVRVETFDQVYGQQVSIYDLKNSLSTSYYINQKTAKQGRLNNLQLLKIPTPINLLAGVDPAGAIYVGEGKVGDKEAYIYEFQDKAGPARVWLWADNGMLLRVEGVDNGKTTDFEFQNIKLDKVDEALFQLPPGITVM